MIRFALFAWVYAVVSVAGAATPIGFRTDGTGRYPDANPPLHWSAEKNVVWKISLPQSNAIPVIIGERLFTTAEPCVLLCVEKSAGRILWQKESSYQQLELRQDEQARLEVERRQGQELNARLAALERQSSTLRKAVLDNVAPKEESERKLEELRAQSDTVKVMKRKLTIWNRYLEPGKGSDGFNSTGGYAAPTPVTDGRQVFVIYGNGLAACYDLDGNRHWRSN